jgi:hypothetical protein
MRSCRGSLEATLIVLVLRPEDPATASTLLFVLVAPSSLILLVALFPE